MRHVAFLSQLCAQMATPLEERGDIIRSILIFSTERQTLELRTPMSVGEENVWSSEAISKPRSTADGLFRKLNGTDMRVIRSKKFKLRMDFPSSQSPFLEHILVKPARRCRLIVRKVQPKLALISSKSMPLVSRGNLSASKPEEIVLNVNSALDLCRSGVT
jgi:hypothetical protein